MWSRCSFLPRLGFAAASMLLAAAAAAQEAPASREEAQQAIGRARSESAEIERRHEQALRDCAGRVLVNPCRERARSERDEQLRAVRQREVAARDTLRRLDAEARAKARRERSAEKDGEATPRAAVPEVKERPAAAKAPGGPAREPAAQREATADDRQQEAASRKAQAERRAAEHEAAQQQRAAKAAEAPAQVERYEERQRAAEARAEEKARIAEENRQRRQRRAEERGTALKPGDGSASK